MKENIIAKLTVKDDKCACAFADKIISEIITVKNQEYPDSYSANLFKNSTKCKAIKEKLIEKDLI